MSLWKLLQRLPAKNVYYYRCPDHRRNYVMSFAFCFDREDDVYQFAYCYPYTYSRLQHYLSSLERRNLHYLQREQLGLSVVVDHSHCLQSRLASYQIIVEENSLGMLERLKSSFRVFITFTFVKESEAWEAADERTCFDKKFGTTGKKKYV
ncbi:hypothetical protein DNTS_031704 [Danionella cerebrum]|uniref:Uncharacterized protein n=1 Tax=Danionella cerebrum TaxID=2873325 RepID=A0A553R805_9TELE|nr:hypothetical protein DNTS_031704 [Danionella translucida]